MTRKDDTDDTYEARRDKAAFEWAYSFCKYMPEKDFREMCDNDKSQTYRTAKHFADWGRADRDAEVRAKAGSVGDLVCEVERLERELKDYKEQLRWSLLNEEKSKENYANVMAEWTADRERLTAENANIKASFDEISRQHTRQEKEIEQLRAERDGLADELKRVVASRSEAHKKCAELRARLEKAEEARTYWQFEGSQALRQRDAAFAMCMRLAEALSKLDRPEGKEPRNYTELIVRAALAEYEAAVAPAQQLLAKK